MTTGIIILVFLCGVVIGALIRPETKLVMESESETIARIKGRIQHDIDELEAELLKDCGWSRGDQIRDARNVCLRLLRMFPGEAA